MRACGGGVGELENTVSPNLRNLGRYMGDKNMPGRVCAMMMALTLTLPYPLFCLHNTGLDWIGLDWTNHFYPL